MARPPPTDAAVNPALRLALATLCLAATGAAMPAPGDQPVPPLAPSTGPSGLQTRTTSLPARGLFDGDRLSPTGRLRRAELIREARELQVEVVLLVPTGPWRIDEKAGDERTLTPARLDSVKRFVAERGVDAGSIYVESRTDQQLAEPRLDVQVVGRDASD
jgi:OOP family OmpA-OmpF porin